MVTKITELSEHQSKLLKHMLIKLQHLASSMEECMYNPSNSYSKLDPHRKLSLMLQESHTVYNSISLALLFIDADIPSINSALTFFDKCYGEAAEWYAYSGKLSVDFSHFYREFKSTVEACLMSF